MTPQPEADRGKVYNPGRAGQLRDYSGIRFGRCTPTDVDGLMDFGGDLFVLFELKHQGEILPVGQELALERLCRASRVPCVLFVAEHTAEVGDTINASGAVVRKVYMNHSGARLCRREGAGWYRAKNIMALGEAVRWLHKKLRSDG